MLANETLLYSVTNASFIFDFFQAIFTDVQALMSDWQVKVCFPNLIREINS